MLLLHIHRHPNNWDANEKGARGLALTCRMSGIMAKRGVVVVKKDLASSSSF